MQEKVQTHLRYGLFTGIAVVIVALILHVAGQAMNNWSQYVMYVPFLIGLIMNGQAFAKANGNHITFGNIFGSCFKASAIVALIVLAWGIISLFIFPDMKDKAMEIAEQSMLERGMPEDQIEQALEMTKKFFYPFMIGGIIFGYMFWGAIFSLISAAIPKKLGNQVPFENTDSQQFQ